jgi:hypothetical protein
MIWRKTQIVGIVLFSASAVLFTASNVSAGDRVLGSSHPAIRPAATVSSRVISAPQSVTIAMTPAAAKEPVYVELRGPDGRLQTFPLEGGAEAITYTNVVLHAGQSVTVHLVAAK